MTDILEIKSRVIRELRALRGGVECGAGCVSWEIVEDVFFWVSVDGGGGGPLVGMALPKLSEQAAVLLDAAGLVPVVRIDWRCSPTIVMPIDVVLGGKETATDESFPITSNSSADMLLENILLAERLLLGDVRNLIGALDTVQRLMPFGPVQSLVLPLGYVLLDHKDEAKAYVLRYLTALSKNRNGESQRSFFERYLLALQNRCGVDLR
jgi:hypothetical protein